MHKGNQKSELGFVIPLDHCALVLFESSFISSLYGIHFTRFACSKLILNRLEQTLDSVTPSAGTRSVSSILSRDSSSSFKSLSLSSLSAQEKNGSS